MKSEYGEKGKNGSKTINAGGEVCETRFLEDFKLLMETVC